MRRLTASIATLALVLGAAACGGGDDVEQQANDALEDLDVSVPDVDVPDGDDGSGMADPEPPEFFLTGSVSPPDGWIEDPANCVDPDESGPPFFTYYVPAGWEQAGSGYGGSGGVGGSGDHSYRIEGADGRAQIEVDEDSYDRQGEVQGDDGEPFDGWDYELSITGEDGTTTEQITYEELEPVEIDGEEFDLFYLDPSQSEEVDSAEYRTRIEFGEVPAVMGSGRHPASAAVTFSFDPAEVDLSEDEVREVLSTFRLADCAQSGITEQLALVFDADWPDPVADGGSDDGGSTDDTAGS